MSVHHILTLRKSDRQKRERRRKKKKGKQCQREKVEAKRTCKIKINRQEEYGGGIKNNALESRQSSLGMKRTKEYF